MASVEPEELAVRVFEVDLALRDSVDLAVSSADRQYLLNAVHDHHLVLAYTAFDGDDFWLVDAMRSYCWSQGVIPVNPESVIGYKDSVDSRLTKAGVMKDDLSVLRRCDEMWIFTDLPADLTALADLAEGALIELCFFALSHRPFSLKLVSTSALVSGSYTEPKSIPCSWDQLRDALPAQVRADILGYLGGEQLLIRQSLPSVVYFLHDLCDSKYANWMRPFAYNEQYVPVIPTLALDLADLPAGRARPLRLLSAWASLMRLASEAWSLPPLGRHEPGPVERLLVDAWLSHGSRPSPNRVDWTRLRVPKAILGTSWPLTGREREVAPWPA